MVRAKIVNCKKVNILRYPCQHGVGNHNIVKSLLIGDTVEIDPNDVFYDLRNRPHYRVYEANEPIGWIIAGAVEVKTNGKQYSNRH